MAFNPCTQASYLALWEQLLPESYRASIASNGVDETGEGGGAIGNPNSDIGKGGAGYDIPASQAKLFERLESALNTSQQAYFCRPHSVATGPTATAASYAVATLRLTRPRAEVPLELPEGTAFRAYRQDSLGAREDLGLYLLSSETTLPVGSHTGLLSLKAELPGYDYNLPDNGTVFWEFLPIGRLDPVTMFVDELTDTFSTLETVSGLNLPWSDRRPGNIIVDGQSFGLVVLPAPEGPTLLEVPLLLPPLSNPIVEPDDWGDFGLTLEQVGEVAGGTSDALAAVAAERGLDRITGESDVEFCSRITTLPDIITPAAIKRIASRILDPLNIEWAFVEPAIRLFEIRVINRSIGVFGMAWDATDLGLSALDNDANSIGFLDVGNFIFYDALARLQAEIDLARAAGVTGRVVTV